MLSYQDTLNAMHVRQIDFTLQEYMFVLQVAFGETPAVAYASVFDSVEFKKNVPSEDEDEYLSRFIHDADVLLEQQSCRHLREYIEQEYQSEIQAKASNLKDFKFTSSDVQKILNNLLHDRSQELSEASVRDIVSLIKSMYDSGALDSGDSFQSHFITVPKKYDCICRNCNREMYLVEGCDNKCPACGATYYWRDNRFYPELSKL